MAFSSTFLLAQDAKFEAFDGHSERGSTSIAYFNQPSEDEFNATMDASISSIFEASNT